MTCLWRQACRFAAAFALERWGRNDGDGRSNNQCSLAQKTTATNRIPDRSAFIREKERFSAGNARGPVRTFADLFKSSLVGAPCFSRGELDFSPAGKRFITWERALALDSRTLLRNAEADCSHTPRSFFSSSHADLSPCAPPRHHDDTIALTFTPRW